MNRSASILSLVALTTLSLAAGCTAETSSDVETDSDDVVTAGMIEEVFVPISNLEMSQYHSVKIAKIKTRGRAEQDELGRCHQYRIDGGEIIICRDDKREIVMDAKYGEEATRWARVRLASGKDQTFTCKKISEQEFSQETYGGTTGHLCKPKAALTNEAKALFAAVDAAPAVDKYPTRSIYLPTNWKKAQPETWATWNERITRAVPVGEYTGYGRTSAKKCKVKVEKEGDGLKVSVVSLDEAGNEGRVNGQLLLNSAQTYGAVKLDNLPQEVSSATRDASVIIASSETETRTKDYYARNFRLVRYKDAPASVEAGQSAIFVDDNYCQRLSPALPAF